MVAVAPAKMGFPRSSGTGGAVCLPLQQYFLENVRCIGCSGLFFSVWRGLPLCLTEGIHTYKIMVRSKRGSPPLTHTRVFMYSRLIVGDVQIVKHFPSTTQPALARPLGVVYRRVCFIYHHVCASGQR